jgi:predicted ATPase
VDVVPGNLPVQESSFVGRVDAVDAVVDAVGEHRVVTLIGVGGVGKTRLALHSAAMLAPQFRDGVWLIELASVTDGGGVDAAVASVFGLQPQPERTWRQVVVDGLRGREVLLVIDNCEHVLDETAALVEALAECASVRVLVTSREALAVGAEWAWRVPSLVGSAAVELFVERADTAASGFRPDEADLVVIGEICDRLDGIALGIELAAARVRSMSPTQIRDRLDERFRLLTGSRRSIERHQTLRHAVQWSYDLLEPSEQTVLQEASVFVGGFDLGACAAVSELDDYKTLDILDSLVRKSLLQVDRADAEVRYRMLETIRQFAEEALATAGTSDATRDRHADYFADQADIALERYVAEWELRAVRWTDREMTNLAAGFKWALSRGLTDAALRIAATTHLIARSSLRTDTFDWPEQVLVLARQIEHRQLPRLLGAACDAATGIWRVDDAVRYGLEAIELNDDDRYDFDVHAYYVTAMALFILGDIDRSLRTVRAGAEHPADHPTRVNLLFLQVMTYMAGIEIPERDSIAAIAQLKVSPMPAMRAGGFWVQANLVAKSDPPAAIDLYQQAIDVHSGARTLEEMCRSMQLELIAKTDDLEAAFTGFAHVVDAWQSSLGDVYTGRGMGALVTWLAGHGYHDSAARLFGAQVRGRRESWTNPPPEVRVLPDVMRDAEFTAAFDAGAALDARAAAELARTVLTKARHDLIGD